MTDPVKRALLKSRISLALDQPFLATALTRLPFIAAPDRSWCQTLATDGYSIFYSPKFVATLTIEELKGVLAHEVLHVVLGHIDRRGVREPVPWNVAIDFAVNLLLEAQGIILPKGALLDRRYKGMAAEEIYDSLPAGSSRPMPCLDNHLEPDDLRCADLRDPSALDAEGRRGMRHELIEDMKEHMQGTASGYFQEEIERARNRRLDWTSLLRMWLSQCTRNDWRSMPFAKKYIHAGLYLPSVGLETPSHIVFAIDTSGSMRAPELAKAFEEVEALRAAFPCSLTRIQCDADVKEVRRFEAFEPGDVGETILVQGRGGTDFRPLFELAAQDAEATPWQIIIVATDGFGTFPEHAPAGPVLWLLTRNGIHAKKIPFGTVIRL